MDLLKLSPPASDAASIADRRAPGDPLGGYVVRAMAVVLVASTLATVSLMTASDANLVDDAGGSTARDEPTPAALVAVENVLGVKLEEPKPSEDVGGRWFGSGFVRWLR